MMNDAYRVREADWERDQAALRAIRESVFVREQGVPIELEWDGLDPHCLHLLAETGNGAAVGTARLLPDGHIGRMAVLPEWRGRGIGRALLQALIDAARRGGVARVILNAQTYAIAFYEKAGFEAVGAEFLDAGIPHRRMILQLDHPPSGS
jgi:predicted GNAT family N-acyltransferase